ncbi:MAG TPA: C4-dicarboxylate ABC transporter permease [Clostridium sp.]|nr:C4-dicarboxylate ABC transporter permease [Clostridium sp.]
MKEEGYPPHFAAAVSGIASILGPIIPPSITLIVYASITDLSVSKLFVGSVIPGILLAGGLIIYALFYGMKHDLPAHPKKKPKEIALTLIDGIWALFMPVIILGGIFGGIFTPTESAAVAVVYSLAVSLFIYKDMKPNEIFSVFVEGTIATSSILMLVGLSKASSYIVTTSGLPQQVLEGFSAITSNKIIILLLLNLLFLVIGMLMEANAAIIMMTPILMPLLSAFGIDPLQFGIIMSFNLCIGLVTPPVGICLLMTNQIARASFVQTLKSILPMLLLSMMVLLLVTFVPQLSLWLPNLLQ